MKRRYRAFLSYSHKDSRFAGWLHKELERWRVDNDLVGRATPSGEVPKSLRPIFRDRDDFAGGASLKTATEDALRESDYLVVICSPNAATSVYVDVEVRYFKQLGRADRIIPVILAGEPGDEATECFPPSVKFVTDGSGELTDELAEPIAADAREEGDGRNRAAAKVAAGLLGLSFDEIARRAERAQRRKIRVFGAIAASMAVLAAATGAFAWLAEERRVEAQENYAAAKTAAGELLEGVAKDITASEASLPTQRRMLERADGIFKVLSDRDSSDLDVVASHARTLGIFAASFRDRGDWASTAKVARQSEALMDRLLEAGDTTENWIAVRASVRMLLLTALEQSGADDAQDVARLRLHLGEDIRVLRESGVSDHETVGLIGAHYLRGALLKNDAGEFDAAAAFLSEGLETLAAFEKPDFEGHRETPASMIARALLDHQVRALVSANALNEALLAAQRLDATLQKLVIKAPDPDFLRAPIIDASVQMSEILTLLERDEEAARAVWRGRLASQLAMPLRNAEPTQLREAADYAFVGGERLLGTGDPTKALEQFQLCAALLHSLLKLPDSGMEDGVQFSRCLAKIEEAQDGDASHRLPALNSSVAEAADLAERFAQLKFFEGLARMRRGFALREAGKLELAAADMESAGDIFLRRADEGGERTAAVLSMAGEAFFSQGEILAEIGMSPRRAYENAVEVYERGVALDPGLREPLAGARRALESLR